MSKVNLFGTSDLESPSERLTSLLSTVKKADRLHPHNYTGKAGKFLAELKELLLIDTQHIDFMTAGNLSLHNIMEFILDEYGPCMEMYISTWAIKEAAARSLFMLMQDKKIGSIHGIFDYRVKTADSASFNLVEHLFHRYELTKNHSKVVLIEYKDRYFTILTSANLSNNPRIETGYISLSESTFRFHKNWMQEVFKGNKVY